MVVSIGDKEIRDEFSIFRGVFNKTIIPLALVGYEMITANYPTRTLGIIVTNIRPTPSINMELLILQLRNCMQ